MRICFCCCCRRSCAGAASERASQIQYAIGQNVVPVYEGWTRNPDGSATMTFGYMNRNYEEVLEIPVGADNRFEPGDADRGQPTHFHVRRQMFVFEVVVPKRLGQQGSRLEPHRPWANRQGLRIVDARVRAERRRRPGEPAPGHGPGRRGAQHASRPSGSMGRFGEPLPRQLRSASPSRSATTAIRRRGRGARPSGGPPRAAETQSPSPRPWSSRIRKSASRSRGFTTAARGK